MKKITIFTLIFLLTAQVIFSQSKVEILDSYIEKARKDWAVPGLAITVVKDGKVLLSRGYGIRELGKNTRVNSKTLFGMMSTTKAMTAVGMGMLVDEGKVRWSDPVIKHLPHFKVADSYVTRELKIRDLFTHNGGLGNADFLWAWTPSLSSEKIVERMQYADQAYSLRNGFIYQNIMYLVAGQVIERVSGMSWEEFMKKRLFTPLGMNDTFATLNLAGNYQNRSSAHYEIDGEIRIIPEMTADAVAPAGSAWSTADDVGKWVDFLLGNTTVNGKKLLKDATHAELLKPHTIIPKNQFYPTTSLTKPNWTTYGLGWFQHDYRGEMINFHTGSLAGRTAIVGLIRDKKVGVYIFGNLDHAEVRHALMYKVFDMFAFDDFKRDWSTEMKTLYGGIKERNEKQLQTARTTRKKNTKPSLSLEAYAGKYSDQFYGTMEVKMVNGKLKLEVSPEVSAELKHWHYDSFQAVWNKRWWGESIVSFQLNPFSGKVQSINVQGAMLRRK